MADSREGTTRITTVYPLFPARYDWPPAVDDVSRVVPQARDLRLVSGAKNLAELPSLPRLRALWCFGIGLADLGHIAQCPTLEALYIENLKTDDLSTLQRMPHLRALHLDSCGKVESLENVAAIPQLEVLAVIHFKRIRDLSPLSTLMNLRSLAVAGSLWTRMNVESFSPLATLTRLTELHLTNIKAKDGSLQPLQKLRGLHTLELANFYPMEEFAALSAVLRRTDCTWFQPHIRFDQGQCKKCGEHSMLMLTGKGKPMACRQCDATRIARQLREWERAVLGCSGDAPGV